jgi:hypothetical protein
MMNNRELDVLVATKIMDWIYDSKYVHKFSRFDRGRCDESDIPTYSTSFQYAWEIVEKLRSLGFTVDISSYPASRKWLKPPYENAPGPEWVLTKDGALPYQCSISRHEPDFECWVTVCQASAKNPAEAVCLAALEAIKPA